MNLVTIDSGAYISHHGIRGQKWGVRRFRNEDGSLTDAGKKRYASDSSRLEKAQNRADKKGSILAKREQKLRKYSKRSRIFMDDEVAANKAKSVDRARRSYTRSLRRADKLFNKMVERYSSEKVSNLSNDQIARGEDICRRLERSKM